MPTPQYTALATVTLTSNAAVTFSGFSQSYRDLRIVFNGTTTSLANVLFTVNGDGAANYPKIEMAARSSSSTPLNQSNTTSSGHLNWATATNSTLNTFGTIDIFDYSATDKHKSYLARSITREGDATYSGADLIAGRWANNSAITTIYLTPGAGSFSTGSVISLYGVK